MGSAPILPIKVTVTIDTMLKLNGPNFGDGFVVGTCEQGITAKLRLNLIVVYGNVQDSCINTQLALIQLIR